jgi:cell division protein FtsQ
MDGGGRELRSVAGKRRTARASIPDGFAFEAGLRRGRIGKTFRRVSAVADMIGSRIARHNGHVWAALFLIAASLYGAVLSGSYRSFLDQTTAALGFTIDQIEIRGLAEADSTEIVDRIDVTDQSSLLMLDAERARERIAEIPWVSDVSVRKLYPGRLQVTLTERRPFALWQEDGKLKVIDRGGVVMAETVGPRHAQLPLIVGDGANLRAGEAIDLINTAPSIRPRVRAAVLVAQRRWNLVTFDGVEIRLPEDAPAQALAEVARLDQGKKLLDRDITAIDLRAADRLYVKLSEASANARREAIKARTAKKKGEAT